MSKFLNGPAAGVTLSLSRSPYFLRVVCASGDTIEPKCIQVGLVCRSGRTSDYAYISDLE